MAHGNGTRNPLREIHGSTECGRPVNPTWGGITMRLVKAVSIVDMVANRDTAA